MLWKGPRNDPGPYKYMIFQSYATSMQIGIAPRLVQRSVRQIATTIQDLRTTL